MSCTVLRGEGDLEVVGCKSGGGSIMEAFDAAKGVTDGLVLLWNCFSSHLIKWNPELVLWWLADHVCGGDGSLVAGCGSSI